MAIGVVGMPEKIWVPPVGYVWTSGSASSPAAIFAGTSWTQIKDRFLMGAGGSYALGSTGGATDHTLSEEEMPAHNHEVSMATEGEHTHTLYDAGGDSIYNILNGMGLSGKLYTRVTVEFKAWGEHSHKVDFYDEGGGRAFNIMNPYIGKYMWRRVS